MDFFGDDFGFSDSPHLKPKKNAKKSDANKSVKGADDFDDLLDELLDKEKKKTAKKGTSNQMASFNSLTSIDKIPSPPKPPKKQEPTDSFSINLTKNESDLGKGYEPLRNRASSRSIHNEDRGSEDGKSYKSGATGFAGFDNLSAQPMVNDDMPQFASSTRMMKPPLRKRAESKMGSEIGQDDIKGLELNPSLNQIESVNFMRPPLPKRDPTPPKTQQPFMSVRNLDQPELKPAQPVIEKQKIVYIKQVNKNIREQFDKQLKLIKQSHEKQMAHLREQLDKEIQSGRQMKLKLMREFEDQREKDKQLYEMLAKKDSEKMKDLYEWELKRKSQAYELEIQRLKKLAEITMKAQPVTSIGNNYQIDRQTFRSKEKELDSRQRRVEDQESQLRQRERALEERQTSFETHRHRQQQKLQQQKKDLFKQESQLRAQKLTQLKHSQQQKQAVATSLSKDQFELTRQKEQVKLEQQELEISRQLFEKQKAEYEEFNAQVMRHYKEKLRALETERNYYQEKEIELYKKIHTVEMVAGLRATAAKRDDRAKDNEENVNTNKNTAANTNYNTKANPPARVDRKPEPKQRSRSPPQFENISRQKHKLEESLNKSALLNASKINLQQYLLKVNKNNERKRPFLI